MQTAPTIQIDGPFGKESMPLSLSGRVEASDEVRRLRTEADAKLAEADAKIETARQLQYELEQLQAKFDNAADRYERAEVQASGFEAALSGARNTILVCWGSSSSNPLLANPEYSAIAKLQAAIADWPRVKKILEADVKEAEAKLKFFQKAHGL